MSDRKLAVIRTGETIAVGDVIITGQQRWTVTRIAKSEFDDMLLFWTDPERHKPIHSYPTSHWAVEVSL